MTIDQLRKAVKVREFRSFTISLANGRRFFVPHPEISAVVDKFRDAPGAILKAQADLDPDMPNQLVNLLDISRGVDAFRGLSYAFDGPTACP